ncbi:hypothetical protein BVRB_8g183470 [Beta vulgaris subsp. vulgaris]|nr:hypothetical protein BVRB_8g183470 [Beta vulgaris subsp. vulgaris]
MNTNFQREERPSRPATATTINEKEREIKMKRRE